MTSWRRVGADALCVICGKSDWCSVSEDRAFVICRRVGDARGRVKIDRSGAEYWVYKVGDGDPIPRRPGSPAPIAAADADQTDAVYRLILKLLRLRGDDRADLRARGLTDADIDANHYRSLPRTGRAAVITRLTQHFGEAVLLSVPGLVRREGAHGSFLTLAGAEGVLVPVRNVRGLIVALKTRRRGSGAGGKYTYLSSKDRGGPGPGSPVHVPRHAGPRGDTVRLTEGELKADVATALDSRLTISVAGVGTWRQALPVLRELGARTCRLAFDADVRTNPYVAAAMKSVALQLMLEGFALELETWAPEFKGIDDCLAANAPTEIRTGADAFAEAERIFVGTRIVA